MIRRLLALVFATAVLLAIALSGAMLASLPALDAELAVPGLEAEVVVERDALGVPTIRGPDRASVAYATGFVHAQDRFFQMDLLRRDAAGELAALVAVAALERDVARRLHRLRAVARRVIAREAGPERAVIDAYARGANAGLERLAIRPFEYLALRSRPEPWRAEDTVLAVFAMYLQLNDEEARRDATIGWLEAALTPEMLDFVVQDGTRWDAPLSGPPHAPLPAPGPQACDLRGRAPLPVRAASIVDGSDTALGGNAWAVSGRHTASGAGLLANDMHLRLRIPNVWYRARVVAAESGDGDAGIDMTGVTLPGTPAVVAGSNGQVAWGFTNSFGDWSDRVPIETDPDDPDRYLWAGGSQAYVEHEETIVVRGGRDRSLRVRETLWGPLAPDRGPDGGLEAIRWIAHDPAATNLRVLRLERAGDVREASAIAHEVGIPPQNFVVVDADGGFGWTIAGRIPRRVEVDPTLPAGRVDTAGWQGWLEAAQYPLLREHPSGRLWTANARMVGGTWLERMGDGGYAVGARAQQIRDRLSALDAAHEADMLAIQLDDRALFIEHWREVLVDVLSQADAGEDAGLAEMARVVAAWDGRAVPDAAGYRLVRAFRSAVHETVLGAIAMGCGGLGADFRFEQMPQVEGPVWTLVTERPEHLLAPGHESWEGLLLAAARDALAGCGAGGASDCRWEKVSAVRLAHPLSRALPPLARLLDMPPRALPGGTWVPRVQTRTNGASKRMAVSPGREEEGYFHMPGGQSGHPLSRFYRAGHEAWAEAEPLPFLPGEARHRLLLSPGAP